jgi:4-amino-4-deoxy-L-arabinose transferase-like glycosyltransferase
MDHPDSATAASSAPSASGHAAERGGGARRSGRDATEDARLWRVALVLVAVAAAVRLLLAAVTPLAPDEAYYWEWSRRLATGYYDHPPAIALMVAAGAAVLGATPLGVRAVPVLAGALTMLLVADLARRHGGGAAALWAAVVSACVPLAAAGLVLATPDTPLLLFFIATLAALDRALGAAPDSRESWTWWIAAGLALGAGVASKYTVVLLPAAVLVAFLARPSLRDRLRSPEPYAAAGAALAVFLPVVLWNAERDWISFAFQFRHGLAASGAGAAGRVLDLLGNQAVLVSPVLLVLLAVATVRALRSADDRRFVLAVVALGTFAFFVYSALRQRPEPNWPAPAYLPALVLLAAAAATAGARWRRWLRGGAALGALMVALIYAQSLVPLLPIPPRKDPMARGHGWDAVAAAASRAATPEGATWFAANRYQDAAMLAFHLPRNPAVFSLNLESRANQYDFWPGFAERAAPGATLVVVLDDGEYGDRVHRMLRPHFTSTRAGPLVELRRGDGVIGTRRLWVLEGWRGGWP